MIDGAEAAEWGMMHRAVPLDELDAEVAELVGGLGAVPPSPSGSRSG